MLRCPPTRPFAACSGPDGLAFVAGEAFELPYEFNFCGCGETTECALDSIDAATRTLSFTTALCPGFDCDCDGCGLIGGTCAVSGLPVPGDWDVWFNGAPAMRLPVRASAAGPANPAGCGTFAEDDGCGISDVLDAPPWIPTDVCVRETAVRTSIEVIDDCGGCEYQGPCVVYFERRTDLERPPGGRLIVSPSSYGGASDGVCDAVCREIVHACAIPDLPPGGGVYDIVVNERVVATFGRGVHAGLTTPCRDGDP